MLHITSNQDLEELAGLVLEKEAEFSSLSVRQGRGSPLGSGFPEISEIILGIGSAGGFIALQGAIRSYLEYKKKGPTTIRIKDADSGKEIEITSEDEIMPLLDKLR